MINKLSKNRGISLISFIVLILIIVLIGFLVYQIVIVDILGIINKNPISTLGELESNIQQENVLLNKVEETENNQYYHYYYEQLDKNGKIIYKGLENNIENMKKGTFKIDFDTQFDELLKSDNGEEKLNIAFQSAWNAFTYDYVDVYYIDVTKLVMTTQTTTLGNFSTHRVYLSNGDNPSYLQEGFTYEKLQSEIQYMEALRKQVVDTLKDYSDYEKIKYLHDWLIDNLTYDTTYEKENIYNIYGALTNGTVVCEGYARTLKYLLDGLDIPCVLVSGTATNSEGVTEAHAWNYVRLDNKWYAIDLTWDDPIISNGLILTNSSRYRYFLKGKNEFFKNHKENGKLSDNSIVFKFPDIESDEYKTE